MKDVLAFDGRRRREGDGKCVDVLIRATTGTICFVRTAWEDRPMTEVPVWLGSLRDGSDRLAAVMELSRRFVAASDTERRLLAAGWPFDANWPYPDPSRLGCQKGETYSSRDRVIASLILDHLEGVFGSREHLIALSATFRSCELAGLDASAVLEDVARCLPHEDAESLRAFLRRPEAERRPDDFGLVETVDVNGEVELSLLL